MTPVSLPPTTHLDTVDRLRAHVASEVTKRANGHTRADFPDLGSHDLSRVEMAVAGLVTMVKVVEALGGTIRIEVDWT